MNEWQTSLASNRTAKSDHRLRVTDACAFSQTCARTWREHAEDIQWYFRCSRPSNTAERRHRKWMIVSRRHMSTARAACPVQIDSTELSESCKDSECGDPFLKTACDHVYLAGWYD